MIEKIVEENNLTSPMSPTDFAVLLSALSDGLLVHWLNDPKAVPNDLFGRFLVAPAIGASKAPES